MRTTTFLAAGLAAALAACDGPITDLESPSFRAGAARPGTLVFHSAMDDPAGEIYTIATDGSGLTRLTDNASVYDGGPRFSPDGRRIVFASTRNDATGQERDLFLMDADGANVVQLTSGPGDDFVPHWSPNGRAIAFGRDDRATPGFSGDIFVIDADGSNEAQLTSDPEHEFGAAWSADGRRLTFARGTHTYVMDADGSNVVQLTDDVLPDFPTDWSSNGTILLNRRMASGTWDLFLMDDDGSNLRQITTDPGQDLYGVFSIDGRWIAVQSDRAGPPLFPHIWIMRTDGSDATQVTTSDSYEQRPDWRPGR